MPLYGVRSAKEQRSARFLETHLDRRHFAQRLPSDVIRRWSIRYSPTAISIGWSLKSEGAALERPLARNRLREPRTVLIPQHNPSCNRSADFSFGRFLP